MKANIKGGAWLIEDIGKFGTPSWTENLRRPLHGQA